ncbi:MAG: hypothetical protein GQ581_05525 [Methyloprofundus sp.]|nr:hypothetical protein [Methyloprofundus sp.]
MEIGSTGGDTHAAVAAQAKLASSPPPEKLETKVEPTAETSKPQPTESINPNVGQNINLIA